MPTADFTVRVLTKHSHREGTQIWKAALIVTGMEGCDVEDIVRALAAFESVRSVGIDAPARWIRQFAGFESKASGKQIEPWLEVTHMGKPISSRAQFNEILASRGCTAE